MRRFTRFNDSPGPEGIRFKAPKTSVSMTKAAKILGLSYPSMKRYLAKGWIRGVRKGAGVSVDLAEIERFKKEGNYLSPAEKAVRDEQDAVREQKPVDAIKVIPGKEPDPVEVADSAYPAYLRNIPKGNGSI